MRTTKQHGCHDEYNARTYDGYSYDTYMQQCITYAKMIRHHDPDPHYTRDVFARYLDAADTAINGVFSDANGYFGFGMRSRVITRDMFEYEILRRQKRHGKPHSSDKLASAFLKWYDMQYADRWHAGTLARMMGIVRHARQATGRTPEIKIMITPRHRYKNDPAYEMDMAGLTHKNRLKSRHDLDAHMQERLPAFLEILNHKRRQKGEAEAAKKHITCASFVAVCDHAVYRSVGDASGKNSTRIKKAELWPSARHVLSAHLEHAKGAHACSYGHMPVADAARAYTHAIASIRSESASHAQKIIGESVASAISFTRQGRI